MQINSIFNSSHIILNSPAKNQNEAFLELAALAKKLGCIDDDKKIVEDFKKREKEGTTGFEDGFAIPHARTENVIEPAILFIRFKNKIDWKAMDGQPTKVAIALLVPADKSADIHLSLLSNLAVKLMDSNFRNALKSENIKSKLVSLLSEDLNKVKDSSGIKNNQAYSISNNSDKKNKEQKLILAITACPTGIAHTFMAADKLTNTGTKLGYNLKVETHGSEGVRNNFTDEEIKKAEVIIIAADIGIELDRFVGKKIYSCPVSKAIKEPETVINNALITTEIYGNVNPNVNDKNNFNIKTNKNSGQKMGILKHLMSGVSYMVPVVILGGICIAFAEGLSRAIYSPTFDPSSSKNSGNFFYYLFGLGSIAFQLMIAVLGAFIANSIAGRSAIAPAIVVSFLANTPTYFYLFPGINPDIVVPDGFVGSIVFGLLIGYTVKWMNSWNVPKYVKPIMPIIIIPVLNGLIYGMFVIYVFGAGVGWIMGQFSTWIKNTWGNTNNASSIAIGLGFGLLIGAMTGFDMGGPINKIAFLTCSGLLPGVSTPMGAMACAIPVAPLGMGFATIFYRKHFDEEMKALGGPAIFMGIIGISEGAIPFAVNDPKKVIPCNVISSAIAGAIGGVLGITDLAAQGGPIVAFLGVMGKGNGNSIGWASAWGWTLIALLIMFCAALLNAFLYGTLLKLSSRKSQEKKVVNIKH